MKIICFGDSLTLPREGCSYEDTWISKLKCTYPKVDFICNFMGGMLISDLIDNSWFYMKHIGADVAIIQEGICDCSPRYVNDKRLLWKVIISICGIIRITPLFWWIVKKGSRKPTCTYTPIKVFASKYKELFEDMYRGGVKFVIIIKIGHGSSTVVSKSNNFNSNVDAYNHVFEELKDIFGDKLILVDPLNQVDDSMFVDGYHCNKVGMELVFYELRKVLDPIIN